MSIEYALSFRFFSARFDIPYSILFVQVALFDFSKFKTIVAVLPQARNQKLCAGGHFFKRGVENFFVYSLKYIL